MAAYVISEVEPRDAALMERYRPLAAESIARHGGRYIVRGGAADLVEGGPPVKTLVIVVFPDMALRLGKFCGNGPDLWLRLQQAYDLWHAERALRKVVAKIPTAKAGSRAA